MRRNAVAVFVLLALASGACKKAGDQPATDAAAGLDTTAAAAETGAAAPATQEAAPAPEPSRSRIETAPPPPVTTAVVQDVPYHSTDTGTVAPGMSEADVVAMWGKPVARSSTGAMTYLYFPNGCERSCGTMDVVFLENDRVVDAILRWPGHAYSGESSSPPGTTPAATRPTQ
jgi:hypothetical protein